MKFEQTLISGVLIKRYKRFLADVALEDGTIVTAHTPNTGSMMGCNMPGSKVWLSRSNKPTRKYPLSWELVETLPGIITGINTILANRLVREGIEKGIIKELQNYDSIRQEVPYGNENSRIDLLLESASGSKCYVEVKNVTLVEENIAYFPDAVSTRGTKHLRELSEMVCRGNRAIIFYCIQRQDAEGFKPADNIDSTYGETLRQVVKRGVEAFAYSCSVSSVEIVLENRLPVLI